METSKLRVRLGAYEFEMEGDSASVSSQAEAFRNLIEAGLKAGSIPPVPAGKGESAAAPAPILTATPDEQTAQDPSSTEGGTPGSEEDSPPPSDPNDAVAYRKIFRVERGVVSLSALPTGPDARSRSVLLIMLGYKLYRDAESVSGVDLVNSLNVSGFTVERADKTVAKYISGTNALMLRFGKHRGTNYRLNNRGIAQARELAAELSKQVS